MVSNNLSGYRFGRLKVVSLSRVDKRIKNGVTIGSRVYWDCVCDCGTRRIVEAYKLSSGHTKSCGCYQSDAARKAKTTHGGAPRTGRHPLYRVWRGMIERCTYRKHDGWAQYGGRGITVCSRWMDFSNFRADMAASWSPGLSIDRIDPNGGYTPTNCRWATTAQQSVNRRNNRIISFMGKSQSLKQWADETGINRYCIHERLKRGWSLARSLGYTNNTENG